MKKIYLIFLGMRVENNTRKINQSKVITSDTTSTCGITTPPTSNTALLYKSASTLEQNTFERDSSYLIYFITLFDIFQFITL